MPLAAFAESLSVSARTMRDISGILGPIPSVWDVGVLGDAPALKSGAGDQYWLGG